MLSGISFLALDTVRGDVIIGWAFTYFVFLVAYFNFFWEKARRYLGLNQILNETTKNKMLNLFDEEGGVNFDAVRDYLESVYQ